MSFMTRIYPAALVAFSCGLVLSACSEPGKYDPPEDFCGIDVGDLHAPLFPADQEVSIVNRNEGQGQFEYPDCSVDADGERVIFSSAGPANRGEGGRASFFYEKYVVNQASEPRIVRGEDYEASVWPGVAYAEIPCPELGDNWVANIGILARYPEDPAESQAALADLIIPYADARFERISWCTD